MQLSLAGTSLLASLSATYGGNHNPHAPCDSIVYLPHFLVSITLTSSSLASLSLTLDSPPPFPRFAVTPIKYSLLNLPVLLPPVSKLPQPQVWETNYNSPVCRSLGLLPPNLKLPHLRVSYHFKSFSSLLMLSSLFWSLISLLLCYRTTRPRESLFRALVLFHVILASKLSPASPMSLCLFRRLSLVNCHLPLCK